MFNATEAGLVVASAKKAGKGQGPKGPKSRNAATVASARSKLATGTGSREEYAAGARAAQAMGDKKTAGDLAVAASRAPSATETLKKTAPVVAAKEAGNPEARAAVSKAFEEAKSGDPEAIRKTGNVVAVQTIDDLNKGRAISPAMRDAVNIQERAAAGDPEAVATVKRVTEAATSESPTAEATAAAVTLSAAAITARALAAKPRAREEFLEKVNAVPAADRPVAEQALGELEKKADAGTITAEEGARGVLLAERLGKPRVAAKIAAEAPPAPPSTAMSSLPDVPQAPITGPLGAIKESLRALLFATRDPLANYREGVASRSRTPAAPSSAGCATSLGWSPFSLFRSVLPFLTPLAASTAAASSVAQLAMSRQKKAAPAPASPAPAPAAQPAPSPAAPAGRPTSTEAPATETSEKVEGDTTQKLYRDLDDASPTRAEDSRKIGGEAREKILTRALLQARKDKQSSGAQLIRGLVAKAREGNETALADVVMLKKIQADHPDTAAAGDSQPPLPDEVRARIQREIDAEGVLPPEPTPEGLRPEKRGKVVRDGRSSPASHASGTIGADKTFRDYVVAAIKDKKISRDDFNAAVALQTGKDASTEKKQAVGEKLLAFCAKKKIKVST